ncbi:MAG: hypothetical protein IJ372_20630 [Rhodococcus sp.]|nr:nicotinamide mononucleotide transporter [Rhodococcus sp. (in: high G+C Gram-positive bacteria)]MBQ7807017.1 hypothetical protein [Rhodococcus sp. (in: high G+C Gram-positive bacteria)]
MSNMVWSFVLAAFGITGLVLAIRGVWWGWMLNLFAQLFWFAFGINTQQYGFVVMACGYGATYAYGARTWWRDRNPVADEEGC